MTAPDGLNPGGLNPGGLNYRAGMTCEAFRELLSAELDGAAQPEETRALAAHLAGCAACARARSEYVALGAALVSADPLAGVRPGPQVWDGIERHLNAPIRIDAGRGPGRAWAPRATMRAAAFLCAVGAAFALGRATAPTPPPALRPVPAPEVSPQAAEAAALLMFDAFVAGVHDRGDLSASLAALRPGPPGGAEAPAPILAPAPEPGAGGSQGPSKSSREKRY